MEIKGVPIWDVVRSLEELFETCDSEYPWKEQPENYKQIWRAKDVLDKIKEEGVLCHWGK